MPTLHSFYLPPEEWAEPFVLSGPEAHHLARVLRIKSGTTVRLFNGQGKSGLFRVDSINKKEAGLSLLSEEFTPAANIRCTLAAGFSKALRRSWFMEKAVELDAHAIWLWQGDYSQASLPEQEKDNWKNSLIAGAKQCESAWLPELSMLRGGASPLADSIKNFDRALLLYEGDTQGKLLSKEDLCGVESILLIVGPEGGFSPGEVDVLIKAGAEAVSLGDRILRWETAAVLTLGIAWWARQNVTR